MKVWETIHLQNKSVSTTSNKSSIGQLPQSVVLFRMPWNSWSSNPPQCVAWCCCQKNKPKQSTNSLILSTPFLGPRSPQSTSLPQSNSLYTANWNPDLLYCLHLRYHPDFFRLVLHWQFPCHCCCCFSYYTTTTTITTTSIQPLLSSQTKLVPVIMSFKPPLLLDTISEWMANMDKKHHRTESGETYKSWCHIMMHKHTKDWNFLYWSTP